MFIPMSHHVVVFAREGISSEFIEVILNNKHLRDLTDLYRMDVSDMHNPLSILFLAQQTES